MPRRRPAAVRADAPIRSTTPTRPIPGIPKSVTHALRRWERTRLWPGAVADAFDRYRRFVHQPGRIIYCLPRGLCPCCIDYYALSTDDPRSVLEQALSAVSTVKARTLRRMVADLDEQLLTRSLPDPWAPAHPAVVATTMPVVTPPRTHPPIPQPIRSTRPASHTRPAMRRRSGVRFNIMPSEVWSVEHQDALFAQVKRFHQRWSTPGRLRTP